MKRLTLAIFDLLLVSAATILAMFIRDDFGVSFGFLPRTGVYIAMTLVVAGFVNTALGLSRSIWRFTSFADLMRLVFAAALTVGITTLFVFWINRLDSVSRSLPLLQFILLTGCYAASRAIARLWHSRQRNLLIAAPTIVAGGLSNVLVVGVNVLTDLYLRSVEELATHKIAVVGILARKVSQTQRSLRQYQILGPIENISRLLLDLDVHGVSIDRIVITEPVARLSKEALEELLTIENISDIKLEFLAERLGFEDLLSGKKGLPIREPEALTEQVARESANISAGVYPLVKRSIDFIGALSLLTLLSPIILLVWWLVAISIGAPVLFWQRRPGRNGSNFKLYKFRTLGPGHAANGRKLTDEERASRVGQFLRNTRLDELPQLFNILSGEMSFVGPRPLLPVDQPERFKLRQTVRPGLTGWAQVNGGRLVSPDDKGAMDVYYVKNMSLIFDIEILLKTIPMVLFREKLNDSAIIRAWDYLNQANVSSVSESMGQNEFGLKLK